MHFCASAKRSGLRRKSPPSVKWSWWNWVLICFMNILVYNCNSVFPFFSIPPFFGKEFSSVGWEQDGLPSCCCSVPLRILAEAGRNITLYKNIAWTHSNWGCYCKRWRHFIPPYSLAQVCIICQSFCSSLDGNPLNQRMAQIAQLTLEMALWWKWGRWERYQSICLDKTVIKLNC